MTDSTPTTKRPRYIYWLMFFTALLALFQAGAAVRALQTAPDLAAEISLILPLEFIAGAAWAVLFAWVTLSLVKSRPHALRYTGWAVTGFIVYSVTRLVIFVRADYDRQRLPFLLVAAVIVAIIPVVLLIRASRVGTQAREKIENGSRPQN